MRLEWIEDILAVLDTGSFAAAADQRFLTPSAFTRRIRGIEEALGCDLFDRTRKPVLLLPHVQAMEAELRDAARQFREVRLGLSDAQGQRQNRLSLGCQHALTTMVSPWLARSLGQGRDIELRIRSGTRSECHLMLLRGQVDFGLIYETSQDVLQFDAELFEKIPLGRDAFIPVGNLRDHADLRAAVDARELPLITYPADIYLGEVLRVQVFPALPKGVGTFSVAETGLTPAVLQFVRQGLGIGWLPRSVADEALARGELQRLDDILPVADLTVQAVRARSGGSALMQRAWDGLREAAPSIAVNGIRAMGEG